MEKSNKLILIIIIVLLVVVLGVVAALSVYAVTTLNSMKDGQGQGSANTPVPVGVLLQNQITSITLEEKTINLKPSEGKKNPMLLIQISVGIDNSRKESEEFIKLAQEKTDVFTDVLITISNNTTQDELVAEGGWDAFKEELVAAFNEKFNTTLIYQVSFINKLIMA